MTTWPTPRHRLLRSGSAQIAVLGRRHLAEAVEMLERDPVTHVFAHHRALMTNLEPRWLGGEMWGRFEDGRLTSMCHVAANVVPVEADEPACADYAARLRRVRPDFVTLLGPQQQVRWLWRDLEGHVPAPRDKRWEQPHLVLAADPRVEPDPRVRRTTEAELDTLYPACVAMYTEEVGVSPETGGGRALYRARVAQLIGRGWSFSLIEDGEVLFKAEVASATAAAAQIQGVYVAPAHRGRGLGTRGMAAVAAQVRRDIAPAVCLYVNEHNTAARSAYAAVGFEQRGTFSTLMF